MKNAIVVLLLTGCASELPEPQQVSMLELAAECGADAVRYCMKFGDHAPEHYQVKGKP